MSLWQVFGLAGCLLAQLPNRFSVSAMVGVRSCLPLRGSSGFTPDSHLSFASTRKKPQSETTISWIHAGRKAYPLRLLWKSASIPPKRLVRRSSPLPLA